MFSFLGWTVIKPAAALAMHMVDGAQHLGFKNTFWQPICGLSEELATIAGANVQAANAILAHLETMRKAALRAAIFVEVNVVTEKAQKGILVQQYYTRRATKALSKYKSIGPSSHLKAASSAGYLKGRVEEYLNLLQQVSSSTNNGYLLSGSSAEQGQKLASKAIGSTPCALTPPEVTTNTRTKTKLTNAGYENMGHGAGNNTDNQHQGSKSGSFKCRLLGSGTTDSLSSAAQGIDFFAMESYIKMPAADEEVTLQPAENLKQGSGTGTQAWKSAYEDVKGALLETNTDTQNESATLDARPDLKEAVKKLLLPKGASDNSHIEDKITEIFGSKEKDKLKQVENAIDDTTIPAGVAQSENEQRLGSINIEDKLAEILSYYQLRSNKTLVDLKKKLFSTAKIKKPKLAEDKEKKCNSEGKDKQQECEN
uniref:Variant surface glycoprotein 1353 n=1 Tax=Trypanosoma brucei TaxID=5691 RepID=M4TBF9_9TRYP|nr:variant surface glycoprotein 1353 [Trypanosoma brucei]